MAILRTDDSGKVWRKAAASSQNDCVEVHLRSDGGAEFRHSLHVDGPTLTYTKGEWEAFKEGMQAGDFG